MTKTTPTAAAVLLLALSAPAAAQDEGRDLRLGLRLGAFDMVNSPDSYDAVYGDPMPLLGVHLEGRVWRRLFLQASLDYGQVDGERAFSAVGIDTTLTYIPLHTAASWRLTGPAETGRWEVRAGLGPSFLSWEDDGDVAGADGTEVGGNALLSALRLGRRWHFGGEVRWSTFPDAVGGDGPTVTNLFDEDDLGGLSVSFLALRGF